MARIPLTASTSNRQNKARRSRNGWRTKWSDELKIKENESTWIQIAPGDYPADNGDRSHWLGVPMFKVQYTNPKTKRDSWGYYQGNAPNMCTLQQRYDCNDPRINAPKWGDPNRFFINVVHFDLFRREQVLNKATKQPLRYRQGKLRGEIIHRWIPVVSVKEKKRIIRDDDYSDCCFFRKKFMELPPTQFETIRSIGRTAKTMCRCGGTLFPATYRCKSCDATLLDIYDENVEHSESEVLRFGDTHVRCRECGTVDYPHPEQECDECDNARSLNFWEVVAQVSKVRKDGWPALQISQIKPINQFRTANSLSVCVTENGEPVEEDGVYTLIEELNKIVNTQFDFLEYTAPKSNSEYSSMLELRETDIGFESDTESYDKFRR